MSTIPVSVLSGFLGSGKTTLVNEILTANHGRRIAVLVNELGEVGVDGALLDTDDGYLSLDNGCICCALNEDLPITLAEIGKIDGLEQVVIETTGIADPMPVGFAVRRPEVEGQFHLDAIIVTVDTLHLAAALAEHDEARAQIERADVVVLTKCDVATDEDVEEALRLVREVHPGVRVLRKDEPDVMSLMLDLGIDDSERSVDSHGVHHDHAAAYDVLSFDVRGKATIRLAFEEFLETLPGSVFRAKGIVPIEGEPGRFVFHRVGARLDVSHDDRREDDGRLVLIGRGLDVDALREELDCLFEAF